MNESRAVEDFWYPAELRSLGLPPTGTHGPGLIFLSGQIGVDFQSGRLRQTIWELPDAVQARLATRLEHRDGREGPVRAQALQAYENLDAILSSRGSSLDRMVRQRLYVADHHDIPALETIVKEVFGDHPPATNIVQAGGVGADPAVRVTIEAIAASDGSERPERIQLPGLEASTGGYPAAVVADGLVFTSGIHGVVPSTGRPAQRKEELPPDARAAVYTGSPFSDFSEEALKAQIGHVFLTVRALLDRLEATSEQLLRTNYLTRAGMNEWGAAAISPRAFLYGDRGRPTITSLSVPEITGTASEAVLDAIIAMPPGSVERYAGEEIAMSNLDMAVATGPYAFTTGYVGMDKRLHRAIRDPQDLTDAGRLLSVAGHDSSGQLRAQAWHTYRWLARLLEAIGSSPSRILQQTLYVRDRRHVAELRALARAVLGEREPPTTVVGVEDIGPYPGLLFEVDVIALR